MSKLSKLVSKILPETATVDAEMVTLVVVADAKVGAAIAHLLAGVHSPEALAKMMDAGAFGADAAAILEAVSGPADGVAEMLSGGFAEQMMESFGLDLGAIATAIGDMGLTPPSSEDAFEKAMADKQGQAMEDDGNGTQATVGGALMVVGGYLMWVPEPFVTKAAGAVILIIGGAVAGDAAAKEADKRLGEPLKKGLETSSNDTDTDTEDDDDTTEDEDATAVAAADTGDDDDEDDDDPAEGETATTMPQDPNVDGSGGGDPEDMPEDDDPTGGAGDPEEDEAVFLFVNLETEFDDHIETLILTDPDKFFAMLPEIDPMQLDELTQPGSSNGDVSDADGFVFG